MKTTEREWKAKAVHRIWSEVDKRIGRVSDVPYSKMPSGWKNVFRSLASGRTLAPIEIAWRSRLKKKGASLKSPFKSSGLSSGRARCHGGWPR